MRNKESWTWNLSEGVYRRLCECRNVKEDLPELVNVRWSWMKTQEKYKNFEKVDAVVYIMELLDSNSQWKLADLTVDEFDELKKE